MAEGEAEVASEMKYEVVEVIVVVAVVEAEK